MSKWSKPQGVVVPLESLLKERRKENCPAPRRSAGLVGRWGITSFTSIRNRGYVVDYSTVNPKEPGLELGAAAGNSPEAVSNLAGSPVVESSRPRKFFKSRNAVLPPPLPPVDHQHAGFGSHYAPIETSKGAVANDTWNHSNVMPPQHFYQQQLPLSAATPQLSPTGPQSANVGGLLPSGTAVGMMAYGVPQQMVPLPPSKEKAPRKKKQSSEALGGIMTNRKPAGKPPSKKEKKEKKAKRSRKDAMDVESAGLVTVSAGCIDTNETQPKRNSSRIRNRVVNYNEEEDDSNDFDRTKMVASRLQPLQSSSHYDSSFPQTAEQHQDPHVSTVASPMLLSECPPRETASGDGCIQSLSGSEGRSGAKPATTSHMSSPSITEHRPILLRISKGTSMLITDSEELSSNHQQPQQLIPSDDGTVTDSKVNSSEFPASISTGAATGNVKVHHTYHEQHQEQPDVMPVCTPENDPSLSSASATGGASGLFESDSPLPKTELKIKISLGGKPLISSTTGAGSITIATNAATGGKGGSKSTSKYNFKKRAIERERARHHLSSKRNKLGDTAGSADHITATIDKVEEEPGVSWLNQNSEALSISTLPPPPPPPVTSSTVSSPNYLQQLQHPRQPSVTTAGSSGGEVSGSRCASSTVPLARHSFPVPGTDTYEVFRTLSSLSGGDDFDSQSSVLGSASSDNNTPKHTLQTPGEDCQIIHSRGSSDCGSDLELSQNSSTAAAPPSDVYSEGENTQDQNHHPQQQPQQLNAAFLTPPDTAVTSSKPAMNPPDEVSSQSSGGIDLKHATVDREEASKSDVMQTAGKSNDDSARRVTRNNTKHLTQSTQNTVEQESASPMPTKQNTNLRVGRVVRNINNNNNVVASSLNEKRSRKQKQEDRDTLIVASKPNVKTQDAVAPTVDGVRPSRQMYNQETDEVANIEDNSTTVASVRPGTVALSSAPLQAASTGPKSALTRQYSRKKKNVVPPDFLAAADTTAGGRTVMDIDLPASASCSGPSTTASSTTGDVYVGVSAGACALNLPVSTNVDVPNVVTQPEQASHNEATKMSHCEPNADDRPPIGKINASPAGNVAPAPMRLVLQKKGTIFKSRPLVGSSTGAADTKKRHVYKHKWDDDEGSSSEQAAGAGGVGTGGAVGEDGIGSGGAGCAGVVGVFPMGSTGGVVAGISSNCVDSSAVQPIYGAVETASDDGAGGSSNSGLGSCGAGGTNVLEYDNDFDSESAPLGMAPRSKRSRTGCSATVTGASSVVITAMGAGGIPGSAMAGMSGGSTGTHAATSVGSVASYHHAYHHENDTENYGYNDERCEAGGEENAKMRCDRNAKPFYTIVRNVKNSHQMQEIGEFQEMDDDVEYILSALQPDNPVSTRCLSALQLATKCMKPAFKMHVRAHGVVTRFFKALSDAYQDASLGLCTAAIMYVFSQDKLNMDLDRDSLELMLNLLDTDHRSDTAVQQGQGQLQKIRQRVKELCDEIKGTGKTKHIDTDRVTAGSLAMESLLSLTSQRAGEWFKDELRNLGGIEHLIKTVVECYERVPGQASDWNEEVVAKLRKIERCLRVLNNVSLFNRQNQRFLLEHRDGLLVQVLVKMYRQFDMNLVRYPTNDASPKESTGVVLRELLQPILHMLITLTHSFDEEAYGAHLVGKQHDVINITMHLLLRIAEHVPHRCVFDFHLLVLTLLLHLARPSQHNRQQVLLYKDDQTGSGGIKSLVEYFEEQEEMASHAEAKTNAILETPARTVDAEDAETKLMQKAEHHMEHTYMGSHVCMLLYHLVMDEPAHEQLARLHLKHNDFRRMVAALSRYYEFLNLTTNADAESTAHKRQTKEAIDYLSRLDGCEAGVIRSNNEPAAMSHSIGE